MTRLVFVSDTHTMQGQLTQAIIAAKADILVHCGDATGTGKISEVGDFSDWCEMLLRKSYVKHVVMIAGNHDLLFDHGHKVVRNDWPSGPESCRARLEDAGVVYLQDDEATVAGLRFYGVPWTPRFFDWAFQIDTPGQDEEIFGRVPENIDVLLTHGPARGIRDLVPRGELVGSPALLRALDRVRPRIHAFGHIHEGYGMTLRNGTLCINASTCTGNYKPTNPPIVVDLP
jgi:Icc-related predicted phosphoesterase